MIVLDTHVLVYDAVAPSRLSARARKAIEAGFDQDALCCADISLWEIAMLIARRRIDCGPDAGQFLNHLLMARRVKPIAITAEIAVLAQSDAFMHGDPADRLIAATAQLHKASLVTSDAKLRALPGVSTIW